MREQALRRYRLVLCIAMAVGVVTASGCSCSTTTPPRTGAGPSAASTPSAESTGGDGSASQTLASGEAEDAENVSAKMPAAGTTSAQGPARTFGIVVGVQKRMSVDAVVLDLAELYPVDESAPPGTGDVRLVNPVKDAKKLVVGPSATVRLKTGPLANRTIAYRQWVEARESHDAYRSDPYWLELEQGKVIRMEQQPITD